MKRDATTISGQTVAMSREAATKSGETVAMSALPRR